MMQEKYKKPPSHDRSLKQFGKTDVVRKKDKKKEKRKEEGMEERKKEKSSYWFECDRRAAIGITNQPISEQLATAKAVEIK